MTAVFHVHSHLLVGGGTSGHIGPLPGRDSDAARTHAATRGAGETRAAGLADLRLGYARPSADQTGHPTCRWPANFAVARQEAAESGMLALPIGRDRTGSSKKGKQLLGRDLLHGHVSRCAT